MGSLTALSGALIERWGPGRGPRQGLMEAVQLRNEAALDDLHIRQRLVSEAPLLAERCVLKGCN